VRGRHTLFSPEMPARVAERGWTMGLTIQLGVLITVLAASLTATASAQNPERAARDARFACILLGDIGSALVARHDASPVYFSRFYSSAEEDASQSPDGLNDFLETLGGHWALGGGSRASEGWRLQFRQLPLTMIREAWIAWQRGGPIDCPEIDDTFWATQAEMDERWRPARQARAHAANLPPDHPLRQGPPPAGGGYYLQISRPVFDDFGYRALVLSVGTSSSAAAIDNCCGHAAIYTYQDGHWQLLADEFWSFH
jgi:hypothetical protein